MKITKVHYYHSLVFIFIFLLNQPCISSSSNFSSIVDYDTTFNQEPEILLSGAYLVIGVFQQIENAQKLTEKANRQGLHAQYKFHQQNQLIYVYTDEGPSKSSILNSYHQLRTTAEYQDAWIFSLQQENHIINEIEKLEVENTISEEKEISPIPKRKLDQEHVIIAFQTKSQEDQQPIYAKIQLVDGAQASLIKEIDSEQGWQVQKRNNQIDSLQVIAEAIGYRKTQLDLDVESLIRRSDSLNVLNQGDTLMVDIALPSMEVGDYQVMYNTYFYGNSTVMRLQSKYELENVFELLNSNPNMNIKLHGHTNGHSRGVAYLFLEEKKNFFEIIRTKEFKKRGVSSSHLSQYRAETIKSYLVSRGIASNRIETMGWGGKMMLYDADSPMAKNNIRVEIEILSK